MLLTYEATKDLATEEIEISTPLERTMVQRISGKKVAICPILRAGIGMLDGVLSLVAGARVGFIGLYRDEDTLQPVEYYVKLPNDIASRDVILLDPMLATGRSTAYATGLVKAAGAESVRLIALIAAPEGVEHMQAEHPGRADRGRVDRPRAERQGLHPPGPRRRRRPPLRHGVRYRATGCRAEPGRESAWFHATRFSSREPFSGRCSSANDGAAVGISPSIAVTPW